ncbi:MAG: hypothetical protein LBB21_03810 [Holosporaceae bacterium]|jgi:hypothetical protein|nr:hypothetical protein [Holosporaceae bacterium]
MKKALVVCGLLFCVFQVSNADSYAVDAQENDDRKESKREDLSGFYFGGGVVCSSSDSDVTNVSHSYEASFVNPIRGYAGDYTDAANEILEDFHAFCVTRATDINFDGAGDLVGLRVEGAVDRTIIGGKSSKVGGSLSAGYGKFVHNDVYLGVDFGLDIIGSKNKESFDQTLLSLGYDFGIGKVRLKQAGVTPTLSARCGVYCNSIDTLIYVKAGLSKNVSELVYGVGSFKLSKVVPIFGVGFEKKVGFLSWRGEFDIKVRSTKTSELSAEPVEFRDFLGTGETVFFPHKVNARIKSSGYAVRLMGVMHIKG